MFENVKGVVVLSVALVAVSAIEPVPLCSTDYGNYTSALAANGAAARFNTTIVGKAPIKCMGSFSAAVMSPAKTAGNASQMEAVNSPNGAR